MNDDDAQLASATGVRVYDEIIACDSGQFVPGGEKVVILTGNLMRTFKGVIFCTAENCRGFRSFNGVLVFSYIKLKIKSSVT